MEPTTTAPFASRTGHPQTPQSNTIGSGSPVSSPRLCALAAARLLSGAETGGKGSMAAERNERCVMHGLLRTHHSTDGA